MLGMMSCGALFCTADANSGPSSSLDTTAWLLLSSALDDALDCGKDSEDRVSGLLGNDGSWEGRADGDSEAGSEASSRVSDGVLLCIEEPRREM